MNGLNKKITSLLVCTISIFITIIIRLLYLQLYCADYFVQKSKNNFIRYETYAAERGTIFDVQGHLLATNRPIISVAWQGSGRRRLSDEQIGALQTVERMCGKTFLSDQLYEHIALAERTYQKIVLLCDIDFSSLGKLAELFAQHDNILIETHSKRLYPYNTYASHVIGYVGSARMHAQGKSGIEKICDDDLSGQKAEMSLVVNSAGKRLSSIENERGFSGQDIHTTINIDIQKLCEDVFPEQYSGCFILFNPTDGAIVSLVSRPTYDPNIFVDPISSEKWNALQERNPFINRALDAHYPSGSIFKLVTISAALEHGIITKDMLWDCHGYTLFGDRKYWCGRKSGHGTITIEQAVASSCNTLFFEIGKKIDIDTLAEYARIFGLGEKTNSILPEKTGLVPTRDWKFLCKGEQWWPGETLSVTIGQSFLLVTPIQIARMIASIFTGYLVSPRLLVTEPVVTVPLEIQSETISFLKKSMKMVVRSGTGRAVRQIKDIKMYGKTSTAQTSDLEKRYLDPKYLEHGWFVGHFRYKDNDPLVFVVMVERVGASHVATTIVKEFLIKYKQYMDD